MNNKKGNNNIINLNNENNIKENNNLNIKKNTQNLTGNNENNYNKRYKDYNENNNNNSFEKLENNYENYNNENNDYDNIRDPNTDNNMNRNYQNFSDEKINDENELYEKEEGYDEERVRAFDDLISNRNMINEPIKEEDEDEYYDSQKQLNNDNNRTIRKSGHLSNNKKSDIDKYNEGLNEDNFKIETNNMNKKRLNDYNNNKKIIMKIRLILLEIIN